MLHKNGRVLKPAQDDIGKARRRRKLAILERFAKTGSFLANRLLRCFCRRHDLGIRAEFLVIAIAHVLFQVEPLEQDACIEFERH